MTIAFLSFIPFGIQVKYFIETRLYDYLIISALFFTSIITQVSLFLFPTGKQIIFQIAHSGEMITWLFLFLHLVRYKYKTIPMKHIVLGFGGQGIIQLMIFNYQSYQTPIKTNIFGLNLRKEQFSPDYGAGMVTSSGIILLGTGFTLLINLYRLYVSILFFYVYSSTELVYKSITTEKIRKLLQSVGLLNGIYALLVIADSIGLFSTSLLFLNMINFIIIGIIIFIVSKYPESLLLTHIQIIRARNLYQLILKDRDPVSPTYVIGSLLTYLENLPVDISNEFKSVKIETET